MWANSTEEKRDFVLYESIVGLTVELTIIDNEIYLPVKGAFALGKKL